ncbi:membrane protein [Sulfuricella sp. T08]|uniref:hypothetical protein n=1 Tax=Sulfuricella sp. T08 TaxID=1632857 RepID=UPI000617A125|nr:hypothetical protein [Sulfuricella sp. T08]GAO37819.1 membrane protein [Sulfuricella sp. T08]
MKEFLQTLKVQRWDDHRYYHQSRINQSLHFVSAISFLVAYVMLFINPAVAGLIGWLVSMTTRQSGHFFFEPKGYDTVNQATHEYKEEIKVGYNLRRKMVLIAIWALAPVVLHFNPTLFGLFEPAANSSALIEQIGLVWLFLGIAGLLFRTCHLFFIRDVQTGLAWMTKILTDPFHDVKIYYAAPFHLLRGELIDPMRHKTGV